MPHKFHHFTSKASSITMQRLYRCFKLLCDLFYEDFRARQHIVFVEAVFEDRGEYAEGTRGLKM